MAMSYGHVYVARSPSAPRTRRRCKAFQEAESYPGPSLIIAYSHCIAHGYDLAHGADQQKLAVDSGVLAALSASTRGAWRRASRRSCSTPGRPRCRPREYMRNETRFRMVEKIDPERFRRLLGGARRAPPSAYAIYQQLAARHGAR